MIAFFINVVVPYGLAIGFVLLCMFGSVEWYREITKYERIIGEHEKESNTFL